MDRQRAAPRAVSLQHRFALDRLPTRYIGVAGTNAWREGWCNNLEDPFAQMMIAEYFEPIRATDGRPFRWTTDLQGLNPFKKELRDWHAGADALYYFSERLPYEDRNYIGHSHGGQLCILLAASGFKIRSLTTVGTPPRDDIPAAVACANIGTWQHIFDSKKDWMGWLGQVGEGGLDKRRSYRLPGVIDRPLGGIDHSTILRDATKFPLWKTEGWLATIKNADLPIAS
jgi:pimeloyl-ACP methyl ester carboxylesterase